LLIFYLLVYEKYLQITRSNYYILELLVFTFQPPQSLSANGARAVVRHKCSIVSTLLKSN